MNNAPADNLSTIEDSSRIYLQALSLVRPLFEGRPDVPRYVIKRVGIKLLECCSDDDGAMLGITLLRQNHHSVAEHCLKVGIVTASLVDYLSLPRNDKLDAVIAGLLHHLGQDITGALASSPGSQAQRSLMSLLLTQAADKGHYRQVLTAFQHQLGYDGTGDPRMDFPVKQHPLSALLTVANDFIELTTSTRQGNWGLMAPEAIARMKQRSGTRYHPELLSVLERVVGPCPVGSFLRLRNGKTAAVVRYQGADRSWTATVVEVGTRDTTVEIEPGNAEELVEGVVDSRDALAKLAS
jgi:HD-GYP domain-containing protein (c-di-GMP phosphodiesterase class II)